MLWPVAICLKAGFGLGLRAYGLGLKGPGVGLEG